MTAADLCLVPLRPTRPDALGIKPTVDARIRGHKRFAFILTQCPTVVSSSRAAEMAAGVVFLGFLAESMICSRADYQDAYAAGQGVTEYAPNGNAAKEIRQLWGCSMSAKTKRPAILDLGCLMVNPAPANEPKAVEPVEKARAKKSATAETEYFRTSVYCSRAVHDKLRAIAFEERKTITDLINEGIDQVLTSRHYPTTTELRGKA